MAVKVAINGFGRIGRNVLRAIVEARRTDIQVVAINDITSAETNAHLLKYDSVHGRFPGEVRVEGDTLDAGMGPMRVFAERDPAQLPWGDLGVDVALECTGIFTDRDGAGKHLEAGAKKVLISAPAKDADITVVYGVNHHALADGHKVVSNASCTTNCLAPVAKVLHELNGKLDGTAIRVPTPNVSMIDLKFIPTRETTVDEVNTAMRRAAEQELAGVLGVTDEPLVSIDFNHNPYSSTFDMTQTQIVDGRLVRVLSWYDNEWGFSNRMADVAIAMAKTS